MILAGLLLVLFTPPVSFGPRLELLLLPVLSQQSVPEDSISRSGDRLCWKWIRDKLREPDVLNIDVFLDAATGDRSYPEVVDQATGVALHKRGALPPGHYESEFCTKLPAYVKRGEQVILRQIVTYRGFLGLWNMKVALPVITNPSNELRKKLAR